MQRCGGGGGGTDAARHGGHDTGDTETDLDGLGAGRRRTLRHRPAELRWGHCITSYPHYATVLAFFLTAPRRESGCWEREITMTCPVLDLRESLRERVPNIPRRAGARSPLGTVG